MKKPRFGRRTFLGGASAVTAASLFPWLRANAQTAGAGTPKLLLYYTPHGTIFERWRPTGGETDFVFSEILQPLAAHRDQIVIVDGLAIDDPYHSDTDPNLHRVPHTYDMPAIFTGSPIDINSTEFHRDDHNQDYGWNTGPSIDQVIADRLTLGTPHRTIELGTQSGGSHPASRMIYSAPAAPRHPLDRPSLAWDQIFRDASAPEPDTSQVTRRTAILDTVVEDLRAVRGTLNAADRARIDAHASALEELETSLTPSLTECELPAEPGDGNLDVEIDRQAGLLTAALACGQTRIGSLQITKGDNDGALYPWVGIDTGGHHSYSHDSSDGSKDLLAALYRWYTERFATLLDNMAAIPDGDGTSLLDNTMVIWGSEIGTGWTHDVSNVPFIVAGGRAHGVRGGRYLQPTGRHNRLLVSAAHYMGLTDIRSFGSMDDDEGPLPGLLG